MRLPPDTAPGAVAWFRRLGSRLGNFLTGDGLPVFLTTAAIIYEVFLLLVIFAPAGWGAWSAFAEEFKIWCFSYNPRTGGMAWMSVVIMLAEPIFIVGLMLTVWSFGRHRPTTYPERRPWRRHRFAAATGVVVGFAVAGGLYAYGRPAGSSAPPLPFPGERIRTRIVPPAFELADHRGQPIHTADLQGKVTLVTGVYALCSTTCPAILLQVGDLLESLPPEARSRLQVVAFSLNPEYDTAELMGGVADAYGFAYPDFRYVNGNPASMRPVLRDFQFSARRNPDTGLIDHANLFLLVDAGGRIAYRFSLDQRHRGWLREAVLALTAEHPVPASAPVATIKP